MFRCKVCQEKDSRIADLKAQIVFLQTQLFPKNDPEATPVNHLEMDGVLSGQQHILSIPSVEEAAYEAELKTAEDERSERDRLLSANY